MNQEFCTVEKFFWFKIQNWITVIVRIQNDLGRIQYDLANPS